jgi:hypothetical protein
MNKYFYVIILFFIILFLFLFKNKPLTDKETIPEFFVTEENKEILRSIEAINRNFEKINHLKILSKANLINERLLSCKASLIYNKNNILKIVIENFFGKQIEVGIDKNGFWFWSKQDNPPKRYYFRNEDLKRSNLKTPICPEWILESMGLKKINFENLVFIKDKEKIGIKSFITSSLGEKIIIVTIIDTKKDFVTEKHLFNEKEEIVVSVFYKSYIEKDGILIPDNFVFSWFQEKIFIESCLKEVEINASSSPNF